MQRRRLYSVQLGVSAGLVLGFYLALINFLHCLFPPYGQKLVEIFQEIYPWYEPSWIGSLVLFGFGMLDGFLALWLVGTLYNWLTYWGYGCRFYQKKMKDQREREDE